MKGVTIEKPPETTPLLRKAAPPVSAQDCQQHQQLLRCFQNLKQTISKRQGLFKTDYVHEIKSEPDPMVQRSMLEERRWSTYTSKAIHRFSVWWTRLPALGTPRFESSQLSEKRHGQQAEWTWTMKQMPPLDVLMVLHALTLHTEALGEDCLRYQKMALWNEGFPLQLASQCIDQHTLTYSCPVSCRLHFENMTKLAWDNLDDSDTLFIECFRCHEQTVVPWSTRRGNGLADNGFVQLCQSCKFILRREALLVQRLREDLRLLLEKDIPLPGTCWAIEGRHSILAPNTATNDLVKQLLGELLREETRPTNLFPDMTQLIKASVEAVGRQYLPLLHDIFEHYQYVQGYSCDLLAAVMRVSKSASTMQNVEWSESDLHWSRNETKYIDFLQGKTKGLSSRHFGIAQMNMADPLTMLWSTHLLAPRSYSEFLGRFGGGIPYGWRPPHDSATCNLCRTLDPPSFARRFIRGLTSLSEWKEWLSTV